MADTRRSIAADQALTDLLDMLPPKLHGHWGTAGHGQDAVAGRGVDAGTNLSINAGTVFAPDLVDGAVVHNVMDQVGDHRATITALLETVTPGGWVAVSVPMQHRARPFLLLDAAAEDELAGPQLDGFALDTPQLEPQDYVDLVAELGLEFSNVQVRTYRRAFASSDDIVAAHEGLLAPFKSRLGADAAESFEAKYKRLVGFAYEPVDGDGTLLVDTAYLLLVGRKPVA